MFCIEISRFNEAHVLLRTSLTLNYLPKLRSWSHSCNCIYMVIDLGQHWHSKWLAALRHQSITCINVDLSVTSSNIHMRSISQERPQLSFTYISLKILYLNIHTNTLLNFTFKTTTVSLMGHWVNLEKANACEITFYDRFSNGCSSTDITHNI